MKMDRKTMLIVGGSLAVLLLVLYLRSRSAAKPPAPVTDTIGTSQDQASADYATLAGEIQQQSATETGDFATLQQAQQAGAAQEQSDVAGLSSEIGSLQQGEEGERGGVEGWAPAAAGVDVARGKANPPQGPPHHKKGQKNKTGDARPTHNGAHVNHHHPRGTAGHAHAPRSHAPHHVTHPHAPAGGHPATHPGRAPAGRGPVHPGRAPAPAGRPAPTRRAPRGRPGRRRR